MPHFKTITFDNDQAFSMHEIIQKKSTLKYILHELILLKIKELLRIEMKISECFPQKKPTLLKLALMKLGRVENKINNRPVRKFGCLTPNKVFSRFKVRFALVS
jgi:IS30 family transposase